MRFAGEKMRQAARSHSSNAMAAVRETTHPHATARLCFRAGFAAKYAALGIFVVQFGATDTRTAASQVDLGGGQHTD